MKVAKLVAVVNSKDGAIPKIIEATVATEIEILLLTDGIMTETESFTGSVKKIMIITLI
jgi:hypothetical protein